MFHTSGSSSVLHNPTEHFTSLNSPSATVRARGPGGDGLLTSPGDKHHSAVGMADGASAGSPPRLHRSLSGTMTGRGGGALRRAAWGATHALAIGGTLRYLSPLSNLQRDLYFLYFQPFLPMLAMLWFWGAAVRLFERRRIRYEACFSTEDQRFLLRSGQLFQLANVLTAVVVFAGAAFCFLLAYAQPDSAAVLPPVLYAALLLLLLFPGPLLYRDARWFFGQTFWRVATPIRGVTWSDFLLADILTSLAKALSDTERAVCHLAIGPIMQPHLKACSDASFIIPLGLAAPYAWRLVQCIRVYLDTGARPQVFNAIKYSTAFPVIILSAVRYHVDILEWRAFWKPMWLAAALLNSTYSYYWDIERDWEISWFSQMGPGGAARGLVPAPVLRPALLYRRPFYLYLMASNLMLRLSWAYKLSPHLRNHHVVSFFIVIAEAFRRFQWLFVRIEVELRKIQSFRPDLGVLVPLTGHAAHAHNSEAADSGSDDESGGGGAKQRGGTLAALASSASGGMPLPGKLRAVVAAGGEVELGKL